MYLENEIVDFLKLPDNLKAYLEEVLETDFEDIDFYFVTYESDKGQEYAVLSAETDKKFAIINCPLEYLDDTYDQEVEDLCNHMLIDWALDMYNKTDDESYKQRLLDHIADLTAPKKETGSPGPLKIGPVINEYDEYEDLYFMPEGDDYIARDGEDD